jgi:hypothetical protein
MVSGPGDCWSTRRRRYHPYARATTLVARTTQSRVVSNTPNCGKVMVVSVIVSASLK